ncbi:hypothetical protein TRVL_08858 [Trypanosoma vivax]|nr:hypothetical protein TRVL_08858 [Trypanosoma vivax]
MRVALPSRKYRALLALVQACSAHWLGPRFSLLRPSPHSLPRQVPVLRRASPQNLPNASSFTPAAQPVPRTFVRFVQTLPLLSHVPSCALVFAHCLSFPPRQVCTTLMHASPRGPVLWCAPRLLSRRAPPCACAHLLVHVALRMSVPKSLCVCARLPRPHT